MPNRHIDGDQEMSGKGMIWFWCPKVHFNPLPVHPMLITSRIFLVWLIFFCFLSLLFHLLFHSIWPYSSISIFFQFSCVFFFLTPPLFSLSSFLAMHILFSSVTLSPIAWTMSCISNLSLELSVIVSPLFSEFVFYLRDHDVCWRVIEYFKAFLFFELLLSEKNKNTTYF